MCMYLVWIWKLCVCVFVCVHVCVVQVLLVTIESYVIVVVNAEQLCAIFPFGSCWLVIQDRRD